MEKKRLIDERTSVQVRKETLKKLNLLKITNEFKDLDSVITFLLEEWETRHN